MQKAVGGHSSNPKLKNTVFGSGIVVPKKVATPAPRPLAPSQKKTTKKSTSSSKSSSSKSNTSKSSTSSGGSYKIKSGDTLGAIARKYGVSVSELQRMNGISNANKINEGATLKIPGKSSGSKSASKPVSKPTSKPAPKPKPKASPKPASKPAPKPVSKPAAKPIVKPKPSAPAKPKVDPIEAQRKAIEKRAKASSDSYYKTQEGALSKARDAEILRLQKAFQNAELEGKTLTTDAQSDYDSAVGEINTNAYNDSQRTALLANQSGIQNSQQMLGLVAGDNARTNTLKTDVMTERDKRIGEIQNRIASLKSQRDLDIANSRSNFDYNLTQARGTADMMYNDKMFGLDAEQLAANREQSYRKEMADIDNKYRLGIIDKEHKLSLEKIALDQKNKLALMAKENEYQMSQMAKQASYARAYAPSGTTTTSKTQPVQQAKTQLSSSYQNYQKAKTVTPTDNYYKSIEKQYNFPIGTSQSYIDNFHSKYTPPPAKNGNLNAWEKSQAMFGRN